MGKVSRLVELFQEDLNLEKDQMRNMVGKVKKQHQKVSQLIKKFTFKGDVYNNNQILELLKIYNENDSNGISFNIKKLIVFPRPKFASRLLYPRLKNTKPRKYDASIDDDNISFHSDYLNHDDQITNSIRVSSSLYPIQDNHQKSSNSEKLEDIMDLLLSFLTMENDNFGDSPTVTNTIDQIILDSENSKNKANKLSLEDNKYLFDENPYRAKRNLLISAKFGTDHDGINYGYI